MPNDLLKKLKEKKAELEKQAKQLSTAYNQIAGKISQLDELIKEENDRKDS